MYVDTQVSSLENGKVNEGMFIPIITKEEFALLHNVTAVDFFTNVVVLVL